MFSISILRNLKSLTLVAPTQSKDESRQYRIHKIDKELINTFDATDPTRGTRYILGKK